jgi:hypothetical protein
MTNTLRAVYRVWITIVFAAVIVQVAAAGYGAFNADHKLDKSPAITQKQFDHGFNFHGALGALLLLAGILLFLFALGARLGRNGVLLALAVPLLVLLQFVLAGAGTSVPAVGALHPVNGFLIAGLTGYLAHRAWHRRDYQSTRLQTPG